MKGKKGICLILCILLLTGLAPLRVFAVPGESVDGVWASVALTGGANKVVFSADSEIEQQILHPDEQTPDAYLLPEGVAYDAESNTLSLTDFRAPTANLTLTMMGGDFKIRLSGSCELGSIVSESKGRGGSVTLCGDGSLELSGAEHAILVRAGGAPDFVRVESQVRLTAASSGSVIRVYDTSLSDGAIFVDTADPQVTVYDARRPLRDVTTSDGKLLDVCTLGSSQERYGLEATPLSDENGDRVVYNIYRLEGPDAEGAYLAGEPIEEQVEDISAYELVCTPHDWTLVESGSGAYATRVRFARFTISARALDEGGTVSVTQSSVARGGIVEVTATPKEGYKLVALTVNGEKVSAPNGSYIIGGITADQVVTASFAAASADRIVVTAPESTAFTVPADGADSFVSQPFTALVTDGAGDPVGASVRWSLMPETEGVSVDAQGRVTVTNAAKRAVIGTRSITVVASVAETSLSDQCMISVSLEQRKPAVIHLVRNGVTLGETDTLLIPAAGESATQQYAAVVYDQYGELYAEEIVWSAGDWPVGVRRDGDTLTVSSNCPDGSSLVVTAAASSDRTVTASVTVSFALPSEDGAKGGAKSGEPVITWPSFTLATEADPALCYGVTWAQLVTLGDDGSASLDGENLPGSFSINRDGALLPNVSDSFRIVFSYDEVGEGETVVTKTIESEAYPVALARKGLDAAMVTLSPSETPYTGAAREPAVSLRDGTCVLALGTDFSVSYSNNVEIGTADVTVEGLGNYKDTVTKHFTITAIPGSSVNCAVVSCKPEDAGVRPTITLKNGDTALVEGTDYTLSLQYDVPAKSGTATITFKGHYSGTRVVSFDLPNYLITEGANSSWNKSSSTPLLIKANGALGKFTELTVDGKTVSISYYSTEEGSTVLKIKADYLRSLTEGKHVVGVAYKDGKALAIFTVVETQRSGVATGDSNNALVWIILLAASLIAFGALAFAFFRSGRKKKKHRK